MNNPALLIRFNALKSVRDRLAQELPNTDEAKNALFALNALLLNSPRVADENTDEECRK